MRYVNVLSVGGELDESYGVSGPFASMEAARSSAIEMLNHTKSIFKGGTVDEEKLTFTRPDDEEEDLIQEVSILALTDEDHAFCVGYSVSRDEYFPVKNGERAKDMSWKSLPEAYQEGLEYGMWRATHPPQLVWFT